MLVLDSQIPARLEWLPSVGGVALQFVSPHEMEASCSCSCFCVCVCYTRPRQSASSRRGEARRTMSSAWIQQIRSEKASHTSTAGSSSPLVFTAFSCWVRSGSGGIWIFRVMFGMQTCSCATGTGPWHEEWVCGLLVLPWLPSPFRVSVGKSAASSRHRRLRLIRVGEGISGSRQGGRSRAHSAALNVSGGWIKMDFLDLREQRSADSQNRTALACPVKRVATASSPS
ncbi:hypothetical protein L207DRAFT_526459 [Hyaloscypha variabilis F]|uniref:Uncharacterized protein n=1 Tax=Hyaloscypha variabilis (strain UAMH 11265 / GT02V1 / F) TaxID=1149755 RepID=A0A2J6RXM7_HYAVF|nr:hypothetical protein L207DRAFT_526459 [Hyaloscypha variabilis F]